MTESSQSSTAFTLREAAIDDLSQIFRVRVSVVENLLSREQLHDMGITESSLAKLMRRRQLRVWCATPAIQESADADRASDEGVIGFVMVRPQKNDVFALFVAPHWQGVGIGTRLLSRAVDWLSAHSDNDIILKTGINTRAQHFYARRGWSVCKTLASDAEVLMIYTGLDSDQTSAT